jgi:hypothetical protein
MGLQIGGDDYVSSADGVYSRTGGHAKRLWSKGKLISRIRLAGQSRVPARICE